MTEWTEGDRFTYVYRSNTISGILVQRRGTIVWNDGENIHYRLEDDPRVLQTPLERFKEIIGEKT